MLGLSRLPRLVVGIAQEANHLADHAELHEMASQRKPDRATQQQDDQDIRPEDVVDDADPFV